MTEYETDRHSAQAREWAIAIAAAIAWLLLATNSADAQMIQVPDIVLAQVLGADAPDQDNTSTRPAESMAQVNLVAQDMRARFQDQLVSGISRPSVELEVHFGFDSAEIANDSRPQIEAAAQVLNQDFPGIRFRVAGFTDALGDAQYNRDLSERRAAAVWQELVNAHGVSADQLERIGYGEQDPSAQEGEARHRRVELQIVRGEWRSL
jgi:outer membrane protein OmpA-like peptidoglycan-associated protein